MMRLISVRICDYMREIDGINIGDVGYDRVCLNCIHRESTPNLWSRKGSGLSMGYGQTNPTDSCGMFSPNRSADGMRNQNRSHDKMNKMMVWKR